jgi:iron complex transport system ATP-binding protein
LAQDAPLLLLDEPAAHLDPGHRFVMHTLLRKLAREENRAVLCVSHDLNLAAEFSDQMMIMSKGSVIATGAPDEVMTEPHLHAAFHCEALRVGTNPFTGRPGTFFAS